MKIDAGEMCCHNTKRKPVEVMTTRDGALTYMLDIFDATPDWLPEDGEVVADRGGHIYMGSAGVWKKI